MNSTNKEENHEHIKLCQKLDELTAKYGSSGEIFYDYFKETPDAYPEYILNRIGSTNTAFDNAPDTEKDAIMDLLAEIHKRGTQGTWARTNTYFYSLDILSPKTEHLTNYEVLNSLTGLYGSDYTIMKKALWYSLIGAVAPQKIIRIGDLYTDIRFNVLYPMPSGSGKKAICTITEEVMRRIGKECQTPTSTHAEQLVGKVIKRKEGKSEIYIPNPGYLNQDYIIFDDANILLTSREPSYEESRRYICRALDPIGRNEIFKRLVDNLPDESLSYEPKCTMSLFVQPVYIPETVVDSGLMRRFIPIYVRLFGTMIDRSEAFEARLHAKNDREKQLSLFLDYLKMLIERCDKEFTFTQNAISAITILHREMLSIARGHSIKGRNFTDRVAFSIQDVLVRMAAIQAIAAFRTEVRERDVQLAYIDLFEFYASTLDFIDEKIMGFLDYGERWRGATSTDAKCLEYLLNKGATSEENSKTSIREYIEYIAKLRDVTTRSAERTYHAHIKNEWVESKQKGSYDSVVWLSFSPKANDIIKPNAITLEDTEYYRIYSNLEGVMNEEFNTICVPTYPCVPSKSLEDKVNSEEFQRIQTQEAAERMKAALKKEVEAK